MNDHYLKPYAVPSTQPVEFVHISAQDFLEIKASVSNFATTSQAFAIAHTVMAQRMARTEAILAQIQKHLGLPLIPLTPLKAIALASPAPPPAAPAAASTDSSPAALAIHSPVVPPATSTALPGDHHAVPT